MDRDSRMRMISAEFQQKFSQPPTIFSRAPGRVDLMGSHTDYNMGYVMTMTIDRDTWIAARPRDDRQINLYSLNLAGSCHFSLDDIQSDSDASWGNYVRGVAYFMQAAGHRLQGFDGVIHSTVPFGSGLSSSAALEIASAVMFAKVSGINIDPVQMALIGKQAENEFVGVNTGILDQYSSVLGQAGCALQLDCRNLTSQAVPIADGIAVVICNTRAERNLVGSEYDDRRSECEEGVQILQQNDPSINALRDLSISQFEEHEAAMPPVVAKRCRFIIEENHSVLDLAGALSTGDRDALKALFAASYAGARDLFEIGAPAMEAMMVAMRAAPGLIAARQAGAGFGGCMVALVDEDRIATFSDAVKQSYTAATAIEPQIYAVTASAGAGRLN